MQRYRLEILNIGPNDPFLWCLKVGDTALALESRLERQHFTTIGSSLNTDLASTLYRAFYEFSYFNKITEKQEPEQGYQDMALAKQECTK
jgi:hypothetical protein